MVVGSDDTGARSSNICLSAATGIHPAPLVQPLSRGLRDLEWLIFAFILLRVKLQTLNRLNCQR